MSKLFAVLTTFSQTYGKIRKSKKKTKQNKTGPLKAFGRLRKEGKEGIS